MRIFIGYLVFLLLPLNIVSRSLSVLQTYSTAQKSVLIGIYSDPYFPTLVLNTERY